MGRVIQGDQISQTDQDRHKMENFFINCNPGKSWQIATSISHKSCHVTCIQFFLSKMIYFHPSVQTYPGIRTQGQAKLCSSDSVRQSSHGFKYP